MPDNYAKNYDTIKTQKFGVEIECTGLTRRSAIKAIAEVVNGDVCGSDPYYVYDGKDRKWKVVYDSSIHRVDRSGASDAGVEYGVEIVTPILEYEDIPLLQEVVRAVRKSGGICNSSTGIHIHIDAAPYTAQKIRNLVNIFASKEDMLMKALSVNENRKSRYCQKIEPRFLEELNKKKPKSMAALKKIWYNDDNVYHSHYDPSRYRCLNLHPLFTDNNFEIRAFNGTLHAGVIRAYIVLALAISNQALTQKYASPHVTTSENEKFTFRTWLVRIGLNGEEFKNCRKHLLSHLDGNIAWLHQSDADAQKERIKQERQALREQREDQTSETDEQDMRNPPSDLDSGSGNMDMRM